jgi:hypothetical protein
MDFYYEEKKKKVNAYRTNFKVIYIKKARKKQTFYS